MADSQPRSRLSSGPSSRPNTWRSRAPDSRAPRGLPPRHSPRGYSSPHGSAPPGSRAFPGRAPPPRSPWNLGGTSCPGPLPINCLPPTPRPSKPRAPVQGTPSLTHPAEESQAQSGGAKWDSSRAHGSPGTAPSPRFPSWGCKPTCPNASAAMISAARNWPARGAASEKVVPAPPRLRPLPQDACPRATPIQPGLPN